MHQDISKDELTLPVESQNDTGDETKNVTSVEQAKQPCSTTVTDHKKIDFDPQMSLEEEQDIHEPQKNTSETATEALTSSALQTIESKLSSIQADLSKLCLKMDNKVLMDDIRDKTISTLSSELKVLRDNQLFRAMKPLINGVIDVTDDMVEVIQTLQEGENAHKLLGYFHTMLHDVLGIVDISPFRSENTPYDTAKHSIVGIRPTSDPTLDKVIALSKLSGYLHNADVMRKEKVTVFKYEISEDAEIPQSIENANNAQHITTQGEEK